jgi:hypothetical protein
MKMTASSRMFNWVQQLDFAGPRINTSIWGWGLLVIGVSAALFAVDHVHTVQLEMDDQQASMLRLQRVQHQRQLAKAPARANSKSDQAWSSDALIAAEGVARLLAYPWAATFDRVEQAALQEQALLLTLSVDQDKPLTDSHGAVVVHISAAVMSDEAALQWASAHGDGAQLLARERLATPAASPQGDYPWRAEVSWIGGRP